MIKLNLIHHSIDFKYLNKKFTSTLKKFDPLTKAILIEQYFGNGIGLKGSMSLLANEEIIPSNSDFQGIYVFSKDSIPFYVGISQHVIERIHQHVKGKDHFSSSFCYRLGRETHFTEHGRHHEGGRAKLDFKKYVEPHKQELMKCNVAFFQMDDCLELYLFEVFVAMKLGTLHYNSFKTH